MRKTNKEERIKMEELKVNSEKYQKNSEHFSEGISLIALIITIILLTILVGVSVNFIVDDKIYDSAQEAVNDTKKQVNNQQQMTDEVRNLYR